MINNKKISRPSGKWQLSCAFVLLLCVALPAVAQGNRVQNGLLVEYLFSESSGSSVVDSSDVGAALNLTIADPSHTQWLQCGGLSVTEATRISSGTVPSKIINAVKSSNAISVEAWIVPTDNTQNGPARIVTLSSNANNRNFTLGQQNSEYDLRLRTTSTGANGSNPSTVTQGNQVQPTLTHVLYTRNASGQATIYVNGVASGSATISSSTSNWNNNYLFGLANEFGTDRAWLGDYYLVSVYDRALSAGEVSQNYNAGIQTPCNKTPTATFNVSSFVGEAPHLISFDASESLDLDGDIVSYAWDFGDGGSATTAEVDYSYTSSGVYNVTLTVTDNEGATAEHSEQVQIFSSVQAERSVIDQMALYTFGAGSGSTVFDVSVSGAPLNLLIQDPANTQWLQCGGLSVDQATLISAAASPIKITDAVKLSNEITVEAWLQTHDSSQSGPARIVTLSDGAYDRNVTLGQEGSEYNVRLRTTSTGINGASPSTSTSGQQAQNELTHVLYTRNASGQATIYVNGQVAGTHTIPGNLSNWSDDFFFGLANEIGADRAWLGDIYLVSIYSRALTPLEVQKNHQTGAPSHCNKPPVASFNINANTGYVPFTLNLDASASQDLDGSIVSYQWDFGDGTTDTGAIVSHDYLEAGVYNITLTIVDDGGESVQISKSIQTFVESEPSRLQLDLLTLYTFGTGAGDTVYDVSSYESPLNLTIQDPLNTQWLQCGGLDVNASTLIGALSSPTKISNAIKSSNAISIEAWIIPDHDNQSGPARIVTLSDGAYDRNFTLAQDASEYDVRFRTTSTGANGLSPSTKTNGHQVSNELTHVLYTRDASGQATIYVNGQIAGTQTITGEASNWDDNFFFGLANEFGADRTWLGEYHLVAVYGAALSGEQVLQNYHAGIQTPCNKLPIARFIMDQNIATVPLAINFDAGASYDLDGEITSYHWNLGDSNTVSGVEQVSHSYTTPGTYVITLTLTDDDGGVSQFSQVVQALSSSLPSRVVPDELVHYNFLEGGGDLIKDRANASPALDLRINDLAHTTWLQCGGLSVNQSTLISALTSPYKISDAVKLSNEITIEAWLVPDNVTQAGPARIVTLSDGAYDRNFTLSQDQSRYDVRLRTTSTGANGDNPSLNSGSGQVATSLQHVMYTRDSQGSASLYIDGQLKNTVTITGHTLNWDDNFYFGLVNEFGATRTWLGDLRLVSVYGRALSAEEVLQNFGAGLVDGCSVNNDPIVTSQPIENVVLGEFYQYQVVAQDIDGDAMNFQLLTAPAGMSIHSIGGLISWQPNALGSYDIVVQVSDIRGGVSTQAYTLYVTQDSLDSDNDGVPDADDAFPFDPTETSDLDGDGIGDNSDPDRDGDGYENNVDAFPNNPNEWSDLDGDGIGDNEDPDRDDDGVLDDEDQFPDDPNEWLDTDGDGIGNNADTDDDNDGVADDQDALPLDPNETQDSDGDGVGNNADPDDDNDGVTDVDDAFPYDPTESEDNDVDGIGNNADTDDDNDNVEDGDDAFPYDPTESVDTDSDGIGNNSDPDIDGDGVNNDDEIAAGTDPYNGQDYPDTTAPQLTVNQASDIQTTNEFITLTGTITEPVQPHSGIALAQVTNSRYTSTPFTISITGTSFSVEVPLKISHNVLTIAVVDFSGNSASATINVERLSEPKFFNVTPADGSIVTQSTITIAGQVHASLPLEDMEFFVNEYQITPNGTAESGTYIFSLPNIPVQLGENIFVLRAVNPDGESQQSITITYTPENAGDLPAPQITLMSPAADAQLNVDSFRVAYRIRSFAGPMTIQFNGQPVTLAAPSQTLVDFSEIVSFPIGVDSVTVDVAATDSLNKSTSASATFYRDSQAPVLTLDNNFAVAPTLNPVDSNVVTLSGTVSDTNLASMLINNQSIRLQPLTSDTYQFSVSLAVNAGQILPVDIQVRDRSGNLTPAEYLLENTSTIDIRFLIPSEGAEFIANNEPINVQLATRLSTALSNGETVRAQINGGTPQLLSVTGTLATGDLNIPATSGDYIIRVEVLDNVLQLITQAERRVSVLNQADIPVRLVRMEPEANAQFVEPNSAIEMYFNRSIELAQLSVSVRETLNGQTYVNDDPLGLDFLEAEGYQLKEVNRNLETVAGQLALIPGATGVAFYPERYFGFNAELFVEVSYAGETLERTTFRVRELPTFVIGNVTDQFGQPLAGINVSMPELNRSTVTNTDGGYAFGFQETGEQIIPGGRHRLIVNAGLQNPNYGSSIQSVNVQRNRKNTIAGTTLTELSKNIPFQNVASLQLNNLAQGDLILNLSAHNARVLFPQGRTSGAIHTQFLPFEHIGVQMHPSAVPLWMFAVQPRGIAVEGEVELSIKVPAIGGSYDYIPTDVYQYVVLLGYNPDQEVLEPVGVGRIENFRVVSTGAVALQSLDFIGYALVDPANNALLEAVANGEKTLQQLIAELQ